jgi:hypothetical protein
LQNYTKEIAKNNKLNSEILNVKYEYVINIYKLLLYRKISNQILEYLYSEKNKVKYYKTLDLFKVKNTKGKKFPIIIAKVSINMINTQNKENDLLKQLKVELNRVKV